MDLEKTEEDGWKSAEHGRRDFSLPVETSFRFHSLNLHRLQQSPSTQSVLMSEGDGTAPAAGITLKLLLSHPVFFLINQLSDNHVCSSPSEPGIYIIQLLAKSGRAPALPTPHRVIYWHGSGDKVE